ncbi:MAG: hypothetical protein MUP63_01580 [Candidatus Nanohaloarchaeota archaeon QJJ-7]|nr:hypothetical protein [Candidatus Nanohaloarchaeota archaeon QJJ-7]
MKSRTRVLSLAVILSLTVILSGCIGGQAQIPTDTIDGDQVPTDGSADAAGDTGTSEGEYWSPYQFEEGENYQYSFTAQDRSGTFYWDVQSVSGDQVTVESGMEMDDGRTFSTTMTGDESNVYRNAMTSPLGPLLASTFYGPWITPLTKGDLNVGNSWSYTLSEGTYTFEVVRTENYAGHESYVQEGRKDETLFYEAAVAPELAFPTHVAAYDHETGEKEMEFTLQDYSG